MTEWTQLRNTHVSLVAENKDSKHTTIPLAVIKLCKAFSWEWTASGLSKKETDATVCSGILDVVAVPLASTHFTTPQMLEQLYSKHQHNKSTYLSWGHHPFHRIAMAEMCRTVLYSNATGARERTFSTLQSNCVWRSLKADLVAGHILLLSLPPQPWESFIEEIFLRIKQCESIFLYSRDSNQ